MTRQGRGCDLSSEKGIALVYLAVTLTVLLLFAGLAVDTGRSWVVKAQLSKAVDAAALGSARNLGGGDPQGEATRIFKANFPTGFGGSAPTDPTAAAGFFAIATDPVNAITVITVTASADVPTTFMKLGNFDLVTVDALAQATRRMVDLSLVLDVSSSIGAQWVAVHDSAVAFLNSFDPVHDRISLLTFSDGAKVLDQMPPGRGFDKPKLTADVPVILPGGSTAMVEGIYRGWDELRSVATGSQSSLRIIVLFTDGASNSVPNIWADGSGLAKGLRTYDFPQNAGDTFGQTWNVPHISGLYDTQSGAGSGIDQPTPWNDRTVPPVGLPAYAQYLPVQSTHTHHRSAGIPIHFPLKVNTLSVDGVPQDVARGLRDFSVAKGLYPSEVWNINNAARNLVEIVADAARSDAGDFKIRIYTIGMGQLVPLLLGTRPETSASMLTRMANDKLSPDYNANQLEGKYFYAPTAADVGPAFQDVQNQIIRLTK
jgi:Mg-chelatase subunit ChlD